LTGLIAYLGPALAEALAVIGTSLGTQRAASAGVSVIAEDPMQRVKVYMLAALPMTQTLVYGFIFMLLSYTTYLPQIASKYGGAEAIPLNIGLAVLGISLFVGFAELFSAYGQGVVCRDGIVALIRTEGRILADAIVLAAYEEIFGMLGLIFAIFMMGIVAAM